MVIRLFTHLHKVRSFYPIISASFFQFVNLMKGCPQLIFLCIQIMSLHHWKLWLVYSFTLMYSALTTTTGALDVLMPDCQFRKAAYG